MNFESKLDRWHAAVTSNRLCQLFAVFTRILLFVGFTPPSIIKILNRPFTVLPDTNPVGHYFNALYQTGFYYQFIGWAQLTAAVLLLFPRTAHLGAFLFLPIIANIAVLTASVGFKGTWLVTLPMTLAAAYLVAWEYDRIKPAVFGARTARTAALGFGWIAIPAFFAVGGVVTGGTWWLIRLGNFPNYASVTAFLAVLGAAFGLAFAAHFAAMRVGPLESRAEADRIAE